MTGTLNLSSYQLLTRPIICRISECYSLDRGLLEQVGYLILWHIARNYPYLLLLLNQERLLGYFEEQLMGQLILMV